MQSLARSSVQMPSAMVCWMVWLRRVNWLMGTEHLDPAWDFGPEGERFEVAFDATPPVQASFTGLHPHSLDDDLDRNPFEVYIADIATRVSSTTQETAKSPGLEVIS